MEALFVSIVTLALGGLGWIAYSHPRPYQGLVYPVLSFISVCTMMAFLGYLWGLTQVHTAIFTNDDIPYESKMTVGTVIDELHPSVFILIGVGLLWLYLMGLSYLEKIGITSHSTLSPNSDT